MRKLTDLRSEITQITKVIQQSILSPRVVSAGLLALVVWEILTLLLLAARKTFWYDELLTLHISSLRPLPLLWRALQAHVDAMTPAYYACVLLARLIPGNPHVVLRLPSVVGYILSLLGVYWFVRRRLPPVAGLCAALLLSVSLLQYYALEARSYALLVGFLAISAALWQRIDEKPWAKPLFVASLTFAVALHYTAVVALAGFGMAELAFFWMSRRFRWSVWSGCLIATVPFFLALPWLTRIEEIFGKYSQVKVHWVSVYATYGTLFEMNIKMALMCIALFLWTAAGALWRSQRSPQHALSMSGFQPPEIVLIGGLLIYPAMLVLGQRVRWSVYEDKWGLPAVLALALGFVFLASSLWTKPAALGLLVALLVVFLYQMEQQVDGLRFAYRPNAGQNFMPPDHTESLCNGWQIPSNTFGTTCETWSRLAQFSLVYPTIPIVADYYMEAMHYAPPELRPRITRVVNPEASARLIGKDSSDREDILVRKFFDFPVVDSASFLAAHKKFIVQMLDDTSWVSGEVSWFTLYLIEKKYHLTLLWKYGSQAIFLAEQ
jgi:hypothetical protein